MKPTSTDPEGTDPNEIDFEPRRAKLLREIEQQWVGLERWTGHDRIAPAVMKAMAEVPRHEFAGSENQPAAYENRPLPVGHGQTISQPFIVAVMTDLLEIQPSDRVLEIGTGSGYQAAVLASMAEHVYSVEFIPELAAQAEARFRQLGYRNISVRIGDGREGWPNQGPFDRIIVTAVAESIPPRLIEQLKPGGRIVIPVGAIGGDQYLMLGEKNEAGDMAVKRVLPVSFVPLVIANRDS